MKIQEMERRTGITKKNIRFYEKEGLLAPARGSNQYREYTEEDVDTLLHIKLLRRLGLSIEEIRLILGGQTTLENGLAWHIEKLDGEIRALRNTRSLCKRLVDEGRALPDVHTQKYLDEMDEMERRGEGFYGVVKEFAGKVKRFLPPRPVLYIEPVDGIVSGADVDRELVHYAVKNQLDLTILRGNTLMPLVKLDGQELHGFVFYTRFGPHISLYKHEEDEFFTNSNVTIKRIMNLFKKHKD